VERQAFVNASSRRVQRVYLFLLLLHTLAASLIWGINTLFLLDAGLTRTEAFAANAFFTAGMVIFEVPTGVIADTRGRRLAYLVGTLTLALSTVLYLLMWYAAAPFWAWASASALLGLGFTFFSGPVEAWLVDALAVSGYVREGGTLDRVLANGKIVEGAAMLCGSAAGGFIAQATNLGVPYVLRALVLVVSFAAAFILMRDIGFTPSHGKHPITEIRDLLRGSIEHGLGNPPVRWVLLSAPFTGGVSLYAMYAMQPYLLELYEDERAYAVAGLAAAIMAGAQIAGGLLVPSVERLFRRRTSVLVTGTLLGAVALALIGLAPPFWAAIALLASWGLLNSAVSTVREAYLISLIASKETATVLSFDSLLGSAGAAGVQPLLGRAADVWSFPVSYVCSAAIQALAIPFLWLARREHAAADAIGEESVTRGGPDRDASRP
jgi:MFS family permease